MSASRYDELTGSLLEGDLAPHEAAELAVRGLEIHHAGTPPTNDDERILFPF